MISSYTLSSIQYPDQGYIYMVLTGVITTRKAKACPTTHQPLIRYSSFISANCGMKATSSSPSSSSSSSASHDLTRTFCHPGRSLRVFTNQHLKKWKPDDEPRLKSGKIHHLALRLRATHWVDLWPRAFCSLWIMSIVRYNLPLVSKILFYHYSAIFSSVICGVRLCWGLLWVSW